ncbi:glucose dehydrogenase [FAD, quinone]-like isoform X2 [Cherax quadricarinatus]|uniref:glucose dehydrogenase [FAD, quinone]-like isoform X2 n=1 Tax=Cherax quadricarinatus TaxID=27406 RepID=UPI0023781E30|nr:glucose dehydrogenase [FAD, quinone]-like isoform X2 [Cherax quadricarinatus]
MESHANRIMWMIPILAWVLDLVPYNIPHSEGPIIDRPDLLQEYDYVIIGGGTAGSVLASRLSEDEGVMVLLVEAGGQETSLSEVPGLASTLQLTDMDWQYRSQPSSTACLAMYDRRCNLPRGRVIGGSSSLNYMLYVRGNKIDYDNWEAQGNTGWSYDQIFPFFKLSEDNVDPNANHKYHGVGGFQTVGPAPWTTPLAQAFLDAGEELGYDARDINAERQTGFMTPHGLIRRGARCSNAKAFLRPVRRRPNLHVALNTMALKLLIDGTTNRTLGVSLDQPTKKGAVVLVRREVVVCAGAINTPQLLMLSGIGPARHLSQHNITVIADLPVGQNFQDHIAAGVIFSIDEPVSLLTDRIQNLPALIRYSFFGTGPLTTLGGVEGLAFINTKYGDPSIDWPDIELQFVAGSYGSDEGAHLRLALGMQHKYWSKYFSHLSYTDHFSIMILLSRPKSRGYIHLATTNPYTHPKIFANYLTNIEDVQVLEEGLLFALRVGNSTAFRKVYGVSGLRVADASIFPTIPTGNINAPVTMVAEKAAHMIRTYWASAETPSPPLLKPFIDYEEVHNDFPRERGEEL